MRWVVIDAMGDLITAASDPLLALGGMSRPVRTRVAHVRAELDKNRWQRVIPLSARSGRPEQPGPLEPTEPLFGEHDDRTVFRQASENALGVERGELVTP
ncbi:MAG: hypothetical protein ABW061_12870 [Polyangiaceae bacterium]